MELDTKDILIKHLKSFISSPIVLKKDSINCHIYKTFQHCLDVCFPDEIVEKSCVNDCILEIESVLDYLHEELNTGHWSKVPIEHRHNFTIASFTKTLILILTEDLSSELLQKCLKSVDLGLLLGAPLEDKPELLAECAKYLQIQLNLLEPTSASCHHGIKRKSSMEPVSPDFNRLPGEIIEEVTIPSIETFNKKFFTPQVPVKLKGCMDHWPATTKWLDLNYLLKILGNRTVPIEIGSHYTDENWSQKLMTAKDFITKHYLSESGDVGYLAQHNLFDQIKELKEDIRIPEYCCCSLNYEDSCDPDINAWLGPNGTVSPLHQDPKNNILAQVYGTKQVLLFSPKDTECLYPHEDKLLSNTAQVDPINPDLEQYPKYEHARLFKCLLGPGEMLFIPVKWWHHVTALEKSFSVSFWWE